MLAACYRATGNADVLRAEEIDCPPLGPGEVLVRIRVSGVNPTDWKMRAGMTGSLDVDFQIPNQDGAGVIEAVGDGVDSSRIGQRVWVYFAAWRRRWGTAAQWSVVPAGQAVELPDEASDDLGASLGIPALTAHRCVFSEGSIAGQTVLVSGGAGAVGHAAIELARWAGARVVATVSDERKAQLARDAGADAVVNYRADDAAEQIEAAAPEGVDRFVEVALSANLALDLAVAAPNATICSYANDGGDVAAVPVRRLMAPNLLLRFVLVYTMPRDALADAVAGVTAALRARTLTTLPLHRFPLDRTADAHTAVERGVVGKVVIDVP